MLVVSLLVLASKWLSLRLPASQSALPFSFLWLIPNRVPLEAPKEPRLVVGGSAVPPPRAATCARIASQWQLKGKLPQTRIF